VRRSPLIVPQRVRRLSSPATATHWLPGGARGAKARLAVVGLETKEKAEFVRRAVDVDLPAWPWSSVLAWNAPAWRQNFSTRTPLLQRLGATP